MQQHTPLTPLLKGNIMKLNCTLKVINFMDLDNPHQYQINPLLYDLS